jgi:hypothetical protein
LEWDRGSTTRQSVSRQEQLPYNHLVRRDEGSLPLINRWRELQNQRATQLSRGRPKPRLLHCTTTTDREKGRSATASQCEEDHGTTTHSISRKALGSTCLPHRHSWPREVSPRSTPRRIASPARCHNHPREARMCSTSTPQGGRRPLLYPNDVVFVAAATNSSHRSLTAGAKNPRTQIWPPRSRALRPSMKPTTSKQLKTRPYYSDGAPCPFPIEYSGREAAGEAWSLASSMQVL